MKPLLLLALLPSVAACSSAPAVLTRSGVFPPGAALIVRNISGDIDAYAPARGQPPDEYTIAAYSREAGSPVTVAMHPMLAIVKAVLPGVRFLIRGPRGSTLDLFTARGNVNVADYEGVLDARTGTGDIKALIPRYGNASTVHGNISVIFASTTWPGTLHFSTQDGNVELYVNENARAHVSMHTGDGTVFSDFNIRGTSSGTGETIDSDINGGGPRSIDVQVHQGSIRLMQLKPQV
jgi:hypothetical protein